MSIIKKILFTTIFTFLILSHHDSFAEDLKKVGKFKDWEVIFWDNQSYDDSKKIFFSFDDKRFKYFLADKLTSLYEARNLAILKCKGNIVTFLDTDDLWDRNKLYLQYHHFIKNNCDISYKNFLILNEKKK